MGHSGKKQGTQAMHLQGQKQRRRTTGAATMQEKETLVVQAKKMHSNSHNKIKEKTGAKPGKKPTPRAYPWRLGGEASVNQPEKKQRAYTSRSAQSWQERNSARDLRRPWSLQRTLSPLTPPPHASTTKGMNCRPWP